MSVRHGIGCQAVRHHIYIYSDKHTSAREDIKISPPNLHSHQLFTPNQQLEHIGIGGESVEGKREAKVFWISEINI